MSSKTWTLYLSLLSLQSCQHHFKPGFSQSGKVNPEINISYLYTTLPRKGKSVPYGSSSLFFQRSERTSFLEAHNVKDTLCVSGHN